MSNMSLKVNLCQLKSKVVEIKGKKGMIKCIILPIDENFLVQGKKGVYLNLTAHELKNPKDEYKQTHLLKQEFPKEIYNDMPEEIKKELPIVGNAILWGAKEPNPVQSDVIDEVEEMDDLPF